MKKRNVWLVLCIAFTCFIFCRSFKSAHESTMESSVFVELLVSVLKRFMETSPDNLYEIATVIVRKMAHVTEYAVQSCLLCGYVSTFKGKIKDNVSWVLFVGLLTACVDESIQLTVEGRAGLLSDIFIDFGGTLFGICISLVFIRLIFILRKKA